MTRRPTLTTHGRQPCYQHSVVNEYGEAIERQSPGELPLTIFVEDMEIVTLMTIGMDPERLALGYLKNQGLFNDIGSIARVVTDWENQSVVVHTHNNDEVKQWREKQFKRIVTSGCGQGTLFADTLDSMDTVKLEPPHFKQSEYYQWIAAVSKYNTLYRQAGSVHSCALIGDHKVLFHNEDVGRHNAADTIAGYMWLEGITGTNKVFYSTGRLTSEMVIKAAFMGIPTLISRSGATHMGLEYAKRVGMTVIARARAKQFLVYNGSERIDFDDVPPKRG